MAPPRWAATLPSKAVVRTVRELSRSLIRNAPPSLRLVLFVKAEFDARHDDEAETDGLPIEGLGA